MSDVPPSARFLQELIGYASDGSRITKTIDLDRLPYNRKTSQRLAAHVMMSVLGDDAYLYDANSDVQPYSFKMKDAIDAVHSIDRLRGISGRTLRRWLTFYVTNGLTTSEFDERNKKLGKRRKYSCSFTIQDVVEIKSIIEDSPQLYLDEIQAEMYLRRGKLWALSTLWRRLGEEGYTLQNAAFRARQMFLDEQSAYRMRMYENVHNAEEVIFIAESARGTNEAQRDRAWGSDGRMPILDSLFDAHDIQERYTFLAAADCNGFILPACEVILRERTQDDADLTRGTVDTARFEAWVERKLVPVLGNYALQEPRSIVVMDYAIIHLSQRVKDLIEDAGALLMFTAPYSPHLNPIKYMISIYKARLRRIGSSMHWLAAHYSAMAAVTPEFARNEYRHCNVPGWDQLFQSGPIDRLAQQLQIKPTTLMLIIAAKISNII